MREDQVRKELLRWMNQVMQTQDWTPEEWARRAQMPGTNITRFLNRSNDFIPSMRTVMRLAAVAGMVPQFERIAPPSLVSVPLLTRDDLLRLRDTRLPPEALMTRLLKSADQKISVVPPAGDGCFAIEIDIGPQIGQLAVVRLVDASELQRNDAVVALEPESSRVGCYHWSTELLFPMGDSFATPLERKSGIVLGRLVSLTRRF